MILLAIIILGTIMVLLLREYYNISEAERKAEEIEKSLVDLNLAKEKLKALDRVEDVLELENKIADKEIMLNKLKEEINAKIS